MRKLFWLGVLLLVASNAFAAIRMAEPQDKQIVYAPVLELNGQITPPAAIKVNGKMLAVDGQGNYFCGLVLKPGKNLVEVRHASEKKRARILKLATFPDVENSADSQAHWAKTYIVNLATLGIVEGDPDGNFYPDQPVTKGELATWLARAKKLPLPEPTTDLFSDVPKELWRAPMIKATVDRGYFNVGADQVFGVDDQLTRQQAIELLATVEGQTKSARLQAAFTGQLTQPLTKAEAALLLNQLAEVGKENARLYDFEYGYGGRAFCFLTISPEVESFLIYPEKVTVGEKSSLMLRAKIAVKPGFPPPLKVKADLSGIGGPVDAEMFDNGSGGDQKSGDHIYSLNVTFTPDSEGEKPLLVIAIDQYGWESKKDLRLMVLK